MSGYLTAVVATVVVVLLRFGLSGLLGKDSPLLPFLMAITIAAWFGGLGPGLLATGISAVAGAYFFEPAYTFGIEQVSDRVRIALFLFEGALISAVCEALHRARGRAEGSRQEALGKQKDLEREVAERSQAEAELRQAEERVRSVVDHAVDAIITIDEAGAITSFNPAAERTFGYRAPEVIGQNIKMLMPEPFYGEHDQYIANYIRTGEAKIIGIGREVVGRRKDGSIFPMDLAVSEYRLGSSRHFSGVVRDITERKQAEEALRESEQRLRLALEAGRMGTWQWNLETNEVLWSPGLEAIHGRAPGTFDGTFAAYQEDIHPDDRAAVLRSITRTVEHDQDHHILYRIIWPDGSVHWVEGRGKVVRDESRNASRMVGVCIDVTERKRAEEALKEADRRKDEFLATLSHELRNPLAPIRNAVQIQNAESASPADLIWTRGVLDRQVRHMSRLVDDLLDVSRISAGKLLVRKERVGLSTIIESAVETSRPLVDAAEHHLGVSLPTEPIHLEADPVRLSQVLSNLLNNAARYTERGGRISLVAEREGSDVVVSVTDSGIGIAPEMLPHVFEVYSQGAISLEQSESGLGIGLSLARALVELHGGSIGVRSEGLGRGSQFTVRLPLAVMAEPVRDTAPVPTADDVAPETDPKYRLLIADDYRDAADSLAILFRIAGHEVATAYDGKEALAAAEAMRPNAVLLDIGMPEGNGYEVARRIRAQPWGKDVFLIALSGWGKDEDRRRSEEAGFNAHLVKPVAPDLLRKALSRIMGPPKGRVAPSSRA
jgi:two-component system CheB/CheR fusion protein